MFALTYCYRCSLFKFIIEGVGQTAVVLTKIICNASCALTVIICDHGLIAMKEQHQTECFANGTKQSGKTRLQKILRVWFKKLLKVCTGICFCLPILAWSEYKIGLAVWSGYPESVAGFKDGLVKDGLLSLSDITFLPGKVAGNIEVQQKVAESFRAQQVDLVYSLTTSGTTVVKEVMPSNTPIIYSIVSYPADSGLIESFEYSGNNLVGTSNYVSIRHYLTMLKLIQPETKRVAIFHRKGEPNSKIQSANLKRQLRRSGIESIILQPTDIAQLKEMALEQVDKVDLFITTTDTLMQGGGEKALIEISLDKKRPILSSNKAGIQQGSLFGPVADFYTLGYMAGKKAAIILKNGIRPSQMSSELQDPPLFLVNKNSLDILGISLSVEAQKRIRYIDPSHIE